MNLTTAFPDLVSRVNGLETTLNGVKSKAEANETSISDIKSQLTTISGDINAISSKLNTLSALLSQRLTALTFAPTQFINGIEVINFATLNYKAWTDVTADNAPTAGNEITINNGKTEAVYLLVQVVQRKKIWQVLPFYYKMLLIQLPEQTANLLLKLKL